MSTYKAGQAWSYRAPPGFERSRLVIGAIVAFDRGTEVICCAALDAPGRAADGTLVPVSIPFLPLTVAAFAASVSVLAGHGDPPAEFAPAFAAWRDDPRGAPVFTVAFEGHLDHLIARQMAAIAGVPAAAEPSLAPASG